MEHQIRSLCERSIEAEEPSCCQSMASVSSLIVNPHTSASTISSIIDILAGSLQRGGDSASGRQALKLLADIASLRPHLSRAVFDGLVSSFYSRLSTESFAFSSEILATLVSLSDKDGSLIIELDDQLFLSLCFVPSVSVRLRLLRNAERFGVRASVLFTVFLGFTKDPYPYVRKAAVDGLAGLCRYDDFEDIGLIEGCYNRAVELLRDAEDCVRSAAVRVVVEWGQMLIAAVEEKDKRDWSNLVFIQLCSVVRDMSVEVRVEAFNALGKVTLVSEDILLQSLSKKVTGALKEKISQAQCSTGVFQMFASHGAGAFLHGLEDEFHQVRKSACCSLRKLVILSDKFSGQALNLLMDMLNDHAMAVRLAALETLHYMANLECLNIQEVHMHMFLGTLADKSDIIRYAARKIFRCMKLSKVEFFRSTVGSLLKNLEVHPKEEADIFSVLFHMGRNHGYFTSQVIKDVSDKLEPVSDGEMGFGSAKSAAYLVLSISAPLSPDHNDINIPPQLFSYAVTLLGRISHALSDIMDQTSLLVYLTEKSGSSSSVVQLIGEESSLSSVHHDVSNLDNEKGSSPSGMSLPLAPCNTSGNTTSALALSGQKDDGILKCMNLILERVQNIWLFRKLSSHAGAVRTISTCKEEVSRYRSTSLESAGALAFTLQYLRVVKLLAKISGHIFCTVRTNQIGELEFLLSKLDRRVREIRSRFIGLSREEELQILELVLFTSILKLAKPDLCCWVSTLKSLSTTMSHVNSLIQDESVQPSSFVGEVELTLDHVGGNLVTPHLFKNLADTFSLRQFTLCSRITHIRAELDIPGNDSENPLLFVAGLPVEIPLDVTLHNVCSDVRLWLRKTADGQITQFQFLDQSLQVFSDGATKMLTSALFYRTPKASAFSMRVCIGRKFDILGSTFSFNSSLEAACKLQPASFSVSEIGLVRNGGHRFIVLAMHVPPAGSSGCELRRWFVTPMR
ncbi:Protein SIEL [Linum perenne]